MRKGSYKNFNRYVNGIFHLSNSLQDSFKLRLFIDYSIYNDVNLFNRIANIRNIQIVLYKCKYFSISKYHLGVFGTIMRLFPLFDFKNNDTNIVIVTDVDVNADKSDFVCQRYKNFVENDNIPKDQEYCVYWRGRPQHSTNENKSFIICDKFIKPYCLCGSLLGLTKKVASVVITDFLLNTYRYKRVYEVYGSYATLKNTKRCDNYICFGFDEYFLNNVLLVYILKNKLPYVIKFGFNLMQCFYFVNETTRMLSSYSEYIDFILKGIMPNLDRSSFEQKMQYLDNVLWINDDFVTNDSIEQIQIDVIKRMYQLMYNVYSTKSFNTIFTKDMLDIIFQPNTVKYARFLKVVVNGPKHRKFVLEEHTKNHLSSYMLQKLKSITTPSRKNIFV